MYLYHATDKKYLASILEQGLLTNPPSHNWEGMYCDGHIFLAFDPNVAEDYSEGAENPPEETVVLKVRLESLNPNCFGYDWNVRCEYHTDINSCVYRTDIPGNLLQVCNPSSEPGQEFDDFEGTELYEILYNTFWEEVETNLERDEEE